MDASSGEDEESRPRHAALPRSKHTRLDASSSDSEADAKVGGDVDSDHSEERVPGKGARGRAAARDKEEEEESQASEPDEQAGDEHHGREGRAASEHAPPKASTSGRVPAWSDPHEQALSIKLARSNRLRKLRANDTQQEMDGAYCCCVSTCQFPCVIIGGQVVETMSDGLTLTRALGGGLQCRCLRCGLACVSKGPPPLPLSLLLHAMLHAHVHVQSLLTPI